MNKIRITIIIGVVGVFGISCLINYQGFFEKNSFREALTPWQSVGGCGVVSLGPSGLGGEFIREPEFFDTTNNIGGKISINPSIGQNFINRSYNFIGMGSWRGFNFQFLIPYFYKTGEVQPTTLLEPKYVVPVGGVGDISFSAKHMFDWKIPLITSLTMQFSTGKFTEKRGNTKQSYILPSYLQTGKGVNSVTASVAPIMALGRGKLKFQTSYSHPFVISFSGKNSLLDTWFIAYQYMKDSADSPNRKRFYYGFKPYGENDLGDYFPPELSFSLAYTLPLRKMAKHIWDVELLIPLGVSWVHEEQVYGSRFMYNPRTNWNHQAWNASFQYGIEFNFPALSFFPTFQIPMHSSSPNYPDPISKWTRPDWQDFGQQLSFMISVRSDYGRFKNK